MTPERWPLQWAAVLVDLDGTLVDSEPLWADAARDIALAHGAPWSTHDGHAIVGWGIPAIADLVQERGVPLSQDAVVDALHDAVGARLAEHIPWRDGALELLGAVRSTGRPCGLVTMSYRRLAELVVAAAPDGVFDVVVAGDDVSRAKPAPDAYVVAARALGVDPRACVVVEDSPPGVTSALTAGAHVFAVDPAQRVTAHPRVREATLTEVTELLGLA